MNFQMGTKRETGKQTKAKTNTVRRKNTLKLKSSGTALSGRGKKKNEQSIPGQTPTKSKCEEPSEDRKTSTVRGSQKKTEQSGRKKKEVTKYQFANNEIVEGVNQYKVINFIRRSTKPLEMDVYLVKDVEQNEELRMKVGVLDLRLLKLDAALLRRLEKKPGDRCFVSLYEYGCIPKYKAEFLIVSPYGLTVYETMRKVLNGPLTLECAIYVALQMLKAIKDLHSIGYLHRNIRPAAFTCGVGDDEASVYLQDFRAARKFEDQKKHVTARSSVKMFGTLRFCSRACQNLKDQGRKDDLECWLYSLFYMIDNNSLYWKRDSNKETVLAAKEAFMRGEARDQFVKAPKSLMPAITAINSYEFATDPDYDAIKKVLTGIQTEQNMNAKPCDWKGKQGLNDVDGETNRSADCKVTGERDAVVKKAGKKKANRKKLSTGDVILSQGAPAGWKVINLLGSGGFGDVYKVHKENQPPTKCYALKTESEEGEKRYLRLKVEVTVMMKTAEKKKDMKFEHFIEFVDRGKCEELKCKFVVMGLVGPSLEDIRRKYLLTSFSKHTSFNMAIQTVQAVKDLHSLGYLHRDIKPANYAVGLNEAESTIYMLDFGIAKLYVDETGNHKVPRKKVKFLGTLRYASRACMLQIEQGRKDDLETWIYMVFDLIDESNGMPWRRLSEAKEILKSKEEFFQCFHDSKESSNFSSLLRRFKELAKYIDKMMYETTPDYEYIITFLKTVAKDVSAKITRKLDWIGKLNKKEFDSDSEKSDKKQSGDEED